MINAVLFFLLSTSSAERLRMVTDLMDSVRAVHAVADSAKAVDTTSAQLQLYVGNHGGGTPTWDAITGKPLTFPPTTHETNWGDLVGAPLCFAACPHGHTWSDISNPPAIPLAYDSAAVSGACAWNSVTDKPAVEVTTNKGAANGYCGLDANSKVAVANLGGIVLVGTANFSARCLIDTISNASFTATSKPWIQGLGSTAWTSNPACSTGVGWMRVYILAADTAKARTKGYVWFLLKVEN